ncbi:MAG: hypothetical protein U1E76_09030 [Planctomycetota bacterium]
MTDDRLIRGREERQQLGGCADRDEYRRQRSEQQRKREPIGDLDEQERQQRGERQAGDGTEIDAAARIGGASGPALRE